MPPRSPAFRFRALGIDVNWLAAACWLAAPGVLVGQRQPVLRQIQVPHSYYYREMYLPQVTTGPSSVTWSPDAREVIYSMQGSLWRQRIGSAEARQLTSGPGYDFQPDWSSKGNRLVYVSYRNDAMELRILELATGADRPLIADGQVNLEPRWSPDGRRLAFVSTAYQGRWHIFVADLDPDGRLSRIQRITEDRLSGLPRYYYGAHDQYLSPTWSPDGKDLIFVSNRNHIWGSGGFWRMPAQPGATPRELRYEETTWKARPDWSPDGRRVVYASYLGAQWHQLWLMTPHGGDPFQLTYGEGDGVAPRWSPDGRRVAFISNAEGNTELRIVDIPGGRIEQLRAGRRIYREPVGQLRLTVLDHGSGRPIRARVSITGPDGRSYAPDDAWRHADDGFDRRERKFEYGYFHTDGSSLVILPVGMAAIEVSRGPEYRVWRDTVEVAPDSVKPVRVVLGRMVNLPQAGWFSGDLHVHMNYGGAYRNTASRLAAQAQAEDLHVVENLIVNKEGRIPDVDRFTGRLDTVSSSSTLIAHDQEYHTSYWGHTGLLGLQRNLILPAYAAYANTAAASLYPSNAVVMDLAHEQGAITGYVHPFDRYPEPSDTSRPLTHELPVDVALGKVDYYEVLGFVDDYEATARVWYQLLNCGFRLPAGAGTDAMANFASLRGPVGMNRLFVQSGRPLRYRGWLTALKKGRSFATNGPLLRFSLEDTGLGGEVRLPAGGRGVNASIGLRSAVPIDRLEIVGNGTVAAEIPLSGTRTQLDTTITLRVTRSGWYLLRAKGNHPAYPILDVYPYATTSPIYVIVGNQAIRSRADADYFIAWIDRLLAGAFASNDWNNEAERTSSLALLRRAREEFLRRRHQ
jgi:TolB protein